MSRFWGLLTPCATVMASILWEQRRGKPGKRRYQAILGAAVAIPVKLSLTLAAAMLVSAVPYMGWRHSYQLGLSELIYELSPNIRRSKKMQREPVQPQAKGREDAMRLASPAACLLLLCIKLFAVT